MRVSIKILSSVSVTAGALAAGIVIAHSGHESKPAQLSVINVAGHGADLALTAEATPTPAGQAVLGQVVDVQELGSQGGLTYLDKPLVLQGERYFWLSPDPGGSGVTLNWGISDATHGLQPLQGQGVKLQLGTPGIDVYREVDNGDAVALFSGVGRVSSSNGATIRSYNTGYQGLRLAIIPGNRGKPSTLKYLVGAGETVSAVRQAVAIAIP